jgi:hypothetical protein
MNRLLAVATIGWFDTLPVTSTPSTYSFTVAPVLVAT